MNISRIAAQLRSAGVSALASAVVFFPHTFPRAVGIGGSNLHAVVPGRVYRSAQLKPERLKDVLAQDGIRTVISLRGGDDRVEWFREESQACSERGAVVRSIGLSATHLPPPEKVSELLEVFDHAQYPVLIHCRSGADRSGLASALYLAVYEQMPAGVARKRGLSSRFGHFRFGAAAMDRFFELYEKDPGNLTLREWITQRYPQVYASVTKARTTPKLDS